MTSRADEDNSQISGSDHVNLVRLLLQGQQSWGETSSGGSKDMEGGWTLRPGPPYPWNNTFHSYLSEPSYFTVHSGSPFLLQEAFLVALAFCPAPRPTGPTA